MKATKQQIKECYKFKPTIDVWIGDFTSSRCMFTYSYEELWYGGPWFTFGCFVLLNLGLFSLHISADWWKLKQFE